MRSRAIARLAVAAGSLAIVGTAAAAPAVGPAARVDIGPSPSAVSAADFTGDGVTDLVAVTSAGVAVTPGMGDGTFGPPIETESSDARSDQRVVAGDVNGDGHIDVATMQPGDKRVAFLLGRGDGTLVDLSNRNQGRSPSAIAVGDLSGDGRADVVLADERRNELTILFGRASGPPDDVRSPRVGRTSAVSLVDLDGDGDLDVAAIETSGEVHVLEGDGRGGLARSVVVGAAPSGANTLTSGDVDGDGADDLLAANAEGEVRVLRNEGALRFGTAPGPSALGAITGPLSAGDVDGDGRADIVAPAGEAGVALTLASQDGFLLPERVTLDGAADHALLADINGDDLCDMVAAGRSAGTGWVALRATTSGLTVTVPTALSLGSVDVGNESDVALWPVSVRSATGGYGLIVQRSPFSRGDLPVTVSPASLPDGASSPLAREGSALPPGDPLLAGSRPTSTPSGVDEWRLGVSVGPVPHTADGLRDATLTVTVLGM